MCRGAILPPLRQPRSSVFQVFEPPVYSYHVSIDTPFPLWFVILDPRGHKKTLLSCWTPDGRPLLRHPFRSFYNNPTKVGHSLDLPSACTGFSHS